MSEKILSDKIEHLKSELFPMLNKYWFKREVLQDFSKNAFNEYFSVLYIFGLPFIALFPTFFLTQQAKFSLTNINIEIIFLVLFLFFSALFEFLFYIFIKNKNFNRNTFILSELKKQIEFSAEENNYFGKFSKDIHLQNLLYKKIIFEKLNDIISNNKKLSYTILKNILDDILTNDVRLMFKKEKELKNLQRQQASFIFR